MRRNASGKVGDGTIDGDPCGSTSNSLCKSLPVPVTGLGKTLGPFDLEGLVCATKPDGTLFCWGPNDFGQIGDGTISDSGCRCKASPVEVVGLGAPIREACHER